MDLGGEEKLKCPLRVLLMLFSKMTVKLMAGALILTLRMNLMMSIMKVAVMESI